MPVGHHRHRGAPGRPSNRPARVPFLAGPIFANIVLADEINRTPPKTQAALLEAMQERQVTVGGRRGTRCPTRSSCWPRRTRSSRKAPTRCPKPSWTASCSRSSCGYPSDEEEFEIVRLTTSLQPTTIRAGADAARTSWNLQKTGPAGARRPITSIDYALALVRQTRGGEAGVPEVHRRMGELGRRPARRAVPAARRQGAGAAQRPHYVSTDDIQALAAAGAAAPHRHQLQRRERRHHRGQA